MSAALSCMPPQNTGQQAAATKRRLIEQHVGLVAHIARHYQGRGLELDDLLQEGALGLIHAAEKFDIARGFQFATYATYWVRQAITLAIANQARVIRLPTNIWGELNRLAQARSTFWQELGREPSLDELASAMWCKKEQVLFLLHQQEVQSLEAPLPSANTGEGETCLGDFLVAPDVSARNERQAMVAGLLTHLSPKERQVIELRYQLGVEAEYGVEDIPLAYTEVGRKLKMTAELVKSVEARALMKMRFWAERGQLFA